VSAIDIDNRLIDARELAEHLGIKLGLVHRLSSDGRIPRYKLGHKTVRFRLCEVLRVFRQDEDAPVERPAVEDASDDIDAVLATLELGDLR
jgi:excisionase family DNA binding protein